MDTTLHNWLAHKADELAASKLLGLAILTGAPLGNHIFNAYAARMRTNDLLYLRALPAEEAFAVVNAREVREIERAMERDLDEEMQRETAK